MQPATLFTFSSPSLYFLAHIQKGQRSDKLDYLQYLSANTVLSLTKCLNVCVFFSEFGYYSVDTHTHTLHPPYPSSSRYLKTQLSPAQPIPGWVDTDLASLELEYGWSWSDQISTTTETRSRAPSKPQKRPSQGRQAGLGGWA